MTFTLLYIYSLLLIRFYFYFRKKKKNVYNNCNRIYKLKSGVKVKGGVKV